MAIKLTCPGCRDAVQADESDRGKKIKCGTCWTDVPVPAPPPQAKAAPLPTAKAVPATPVAAAKPIVTAAPIPVPAVGPKKATPVPAAAPAPAAKPVVATALPATAVPAARPAPPVASKSKAKDDEPESKKKRFQERDRGRDDDDDDDDRSKGKAKKGGGGGVLIAFLCIGAVMLMGVAGGIAVIVMNNGSGSAAATTSPTTQAAPNVNPQGGGGMPLQPRNPGDFNPGGGGVVDPNPIPPRPPVARPQGWAEFKGKDFTCDMPGGVNKAADTFPFATRDVTGTAYTAGELNNAIKVTVKELALPVGTSATSSAFVAAAFAVPEADLKKDPAGRLVSGNPGVEYTTRTADGYENVILTVGVGTKNAFLFRYQWKANTPTADEKRDNFFASLNVLLEGEVPVVRDPFGGGRPDPKVPKAITQPWKPLENKDGFEVQVPPGVDKGEKQLLEAENRTAWVGGKKWTADDGDVAYHVFCHDLAPDKLDLDLRKIASPLVRAVFPHEVNTEEVAKVDGKAAVRWNIRHFHGGMSHGVSVRVGYRVFTFFCTSKHGIHSAADATLTEREDKFLNSIKIPFDPKTHNPYQDEPEWVAMKATLGFTALIPKQATTEHEFKPRAFDYKPGREWRAEVDGITYHAYAINITPPVKKTFNDPDMSSTEVAKSAFGFAVTPESGPNKAKIGNGLDAEEWTLKGDRGPNHVRQVVSGRVVFTLKTIRGGWDNKVGDKEYADKSARFFDAFRLGEGVIAPGGGIPGGGVVGGGNTGEFVKLADAKVQPFWTGVFLPQKKEFVTFGVKDSTARPVRGVVRRYSVPEFKLKATYETQSPINRVTADETNGRLFAATVQQAEDAKTPEKDNLIATGDVLQFDLLKLTDGSLTEGDRVSAVNVIQSSNAAFRVSGLEATADGSAVYVSGVTVSGKAPRLVFRGKLMKWDTAARKMQDDIVTDSPVWALAVSADGKKVIGLERNMDPTKTAGNLLVIDGPTWKRSSTVPLAGTPADVAFRNDRVAVVVSTGPGQAKLLVGPVDGDLSETTPGGDVNCVRFTPGGTKLLVSAGGQASGLTLFDVDGAKPPKLTKAASAGELAGLFVVSPDGKMAVTNTGAVLDLEKSKAK